MKSIPNVLVVEDEPSIADLISTNLKHSGWLPILAGDGIEAQEKIEENVPDLILLDWMLPGQSGIQLARKWRQNPKTKTVPILMLTGRADEVDKVAGLDAGADDYIVKPFSTQELMARIRAVLRRRAPEFARESLKLGDLVLDSDTYRVFYKEDELKLGPTEFKLLQYFMKTPERVHSRSQLLDKVWGDHVFIEERTVDVHVKRLRAALGKKANKMIETVRGVGYRMTARISID